MQDGDEPALLRVEDAYVGPSASYFRDQQPTSARWLRDGDFVDMSVIWWNGRSWTPVENTSDPKRAARKLLELSSVREMREAIKKAPSYSTRDNPDPKDNPYYYRSELKKIPKEKRQLDYGDYEETDPLGFHITQPDMYDAETTGTWSREQTRANPSRRSVRPPGVSQATKTFESFNEYPSKGVSKFAKEIVVPERMPSPGPCRWVTYRSDKWKNGTHDYIHKISSYPRVKCVMAGEDYPTVKVPLKVRNATTLTQIGLRALGFAFEYDGEEYEAKVPAGTEWFWSQSARALYLIQNKRKLIALVWGGQLNVEARGIVG
jgi:hypothetical protein